MYATLNQKSWDEILRSIDFAWQPPCTVHLPIQPAHSRDFVHVDCALNACRRRVVPRLSFLDEAAYAAVRASETLLVQFAVDQPAYMPDFRATRLGLAGGHHPVAQAEYFARDLRYEFEYACCQLGEESQAQSVLSITCRVTSEDHLPREAHVRAKVNFQPEDRYFDNHYVPFYWDTTKWLPCTLTSLSGQTILREGHAIGRVQPGGFTCEWEPRAEFNDADYAAMWGTHSPFSVNHIYRLKQVQDTFHFHAELQPGEQRTFQLLLLVDYEHATPEQLQALAALTPESCRDQSIAHFRAQQPAGATELVCPAQRWGDIFAEAQTNTLQLLVQTDRPGEWMPTQGGSTERHFVWVWEAMCMLRPMLRLGHFEAVRRSLAFILSLQDGGFPPSGRFASLDGAIGTTGPRWINSTGSALALAAEYAMYSGDTDFLAENLARLLKAADWIVRELRATRELNPDGSRPLVYGLMPYGCGTDGDVGYIVSFTDAYTYLGLDKLAQLLERTGHARAAELRREVDQYRADIGACITALAQPSGYIPRRVATGDENIFWKFEHIGGITHLTYCDAIDVDADLLRRYVDYYEHNLTDGPFLGHMDRDIVYMGIAEWLWQDVYLKTGESRKAFLANQANLQYGLSQDTFQVLERFSRLDPAFTPWQPNGSGNGRLLEMMVKSLYFEDAGTATLFGAFPFAWLRDNGTTALRRLHTLAGSLTLEATMIDPQHCRISLSADRAAAMPRHVRFPDHLKAAAITPGMSPADGTFTVQPDTARLDFTVSE
jgi:hypothetical protein